MRKVWQSFFFLFAVAALCIGCHPSRSTRIALENPNTWTNRINDPGLTENEFVKLYGEAILRRFPGAFVEIVGPREIRLTMTNGRSSTFFTYNAWRQCQQDPAKRASICNDCIASILAQLAGSWAAQPRLDTNNVMLVVRDREFAAQARRLSAKTNAPVCEPFVADLWLFYVADSSNSIQYLTPAQLHEASLPAEELRDLAMSNLRRAFPKPKLTTIGPIHLVSVGGTYEPSLLLDDTFWADKASMVEGEIVAAVPSSDVLLFTGTKSPNGIAGIRRIVADITTHYPRPISETLLVRRQGKWEPFDAGR